MQTNGDIDTVLLRDSLTRYNSDIERCKTEIENNKQNFSIHKKYLNTAIDLFSEMGSFYRNADTQYLQGFE